MALIGQEAIDAVSRLRIKYLKYTEHTLFIRASDERNFYAHSYVVLEARTPKPLLRKKCVVEKKDYMELAESGAVVERMLQWLYNIPWPDSSAEVNIGTEMMTMIQVAKAAGKYANRSIMHYEIRPMHKAALARAQDLVNGFTTHKQCMRLIRDLMEGSVEGAIVEKLLERLDELMVERTKRARV